MSIGVKCNLNRKGFIICCNCIYNLFAIDNFSSLAVHGYCFWEYWDFFVLFFFVKAL